MAVMSAEAAIAERAHAHSRAGAEVGTGGGHALFGLVALAAFAVYWASAVILQARGATTHFGADAHLYSLLVDGRPVDRITRFHPLTTALVAVWMKALAPLTPWIAPANLLKALFAAAGALGVWAAMWTLAAVVPRRYAVLLGTIYATSLGVWYFSSIEESKIVSTALATLYIGVYLRLRTGWTPRRAALLTAILLVACLNEVIAAFLVVIPAVDTLIQRGWHPRHYRWVLWHALAAPLALLLLEGVVNMVLIPENQVEGRSHLSMLVYYLGRNVYSAEHVYGFLIQWLFFNIVAPSMDASFNPGLPNTWAGDFEMRLANYLASPLTAGLLVLLGAMLAAIVLPRYRGDRPAGLVGLLPALAVFALLRGAFFLVFNPHECLLFSSGTTLTHMLLIGIPFVGSRFPAKQGILAVSAALLLIVNGSFIIGG
jgi:hypothetical protein